MLSDRGIRQAMKDGSLVIEPFDEKFLGPCSYDLEIKRIYRVEKPNKPFLTEDDIDDSPMERFLETDCEAYDGLLLPGKSYIGASRERIWARQHPGVTTRSGPARLGIETWPVNIAEIYAEPTCVYFSIRTYDTVCEVPEGRRLSQIFFDQGLPLFPSEIEPLILQGRLGVNGRPVFEGCRGIRLGIGRTIRRYNGKVLALDGRNDECFDDEEIRGTYRFRPGGFYLCHTDELVSMPDDHAGMLVKAKGIRLRGNVHPNAPLIAPGSEGHQILEMNFPAGLEIRKGDHVCSMEIMPLDQNPQNAYNGKYKGQRGPQTSLFHTEGV